MKRQQMLLLLLAGVGALAVWALLGRQRSSATAPASSSGMPSSWATLQDQREQVGEGLFDFLNEPSQVPAVTVAPSSLAGGSSSAGSTAVTSAPTRTESGAAARRTFLGVDP